MFDHHVGAGVRCHRGQHTGAQRDQVWQGLGENRGQDVAAQSRFELYQLSMLVDLQVNGIPGQPQAQPSSDSGRQIAAISGGGKEHGIGLCGVYGVGQRVADGATPDRTTMRMTQDHYPVRPIGSKLLHQVVRRRAKEDGHYLAPGSGRQRPGFAQHLTRDMPQAPAGQFCHHPDTLLALAWIPLSAYQGVRLACRRQCRQPLLHQCCHPLCGGGGLRLGDDYAQAVGGDHTDRVHPGRGPRQAKECRVCR